MPKVGGLKIVRVSFTVDPETERELKRRARALRISVSAYVRQLGAQLRDEAAKTEAPKSEAQPETG